MLMRILAIFPSLLSVIDSAIAAARLRRARRRAQRIVAGQEETTPAAFERLRQTITDLVEAGHSSQPQPDRHLIETLGRMREK